jgi:hypothetical protein
MAKIKRICYIAVVLLYQWRIHACQSLPHQNSNRQLLTPAKLSIFMPELPGAFQCSLAGRNSFNSGPSRSQLEVSVLRQSISDLRRSLDCWRGRAASIRGSLHSVTSETNGVMKIADERGVETAIVDLPDPKRDSIHISRNNCQILRR